MASSWPTSLASEEEVELVRGPLSSSAAPKPTPPGAASSSSYQPLSAGWASRRQRFKVALAEMPPSLLRRIFVWAAVALLAACLALTLAVLALACRESGCLDRARQLGFSSGLEGLGSSSLLRGHTALRTPAVASRIAFGSCTSYDAHTPQPIWEEGVIPARPDAWVWLGDMAYSDVPSEDCWHQDKDTKVQNPECVCAGTAGHPANESCQAGDQDNALRKFQAQLVQPGYQAFLRHMCPFAPHASLPTLAPPGEDPAACPRPVLGVYDDHDWGLNNGDARLPLKAQMKGIFLDALGVSRDSPRRDALRGAQWHYTFNPESRRKSMDLTLLDERYYRAPLPCRTRRRWCETVVLEHRGPVPHAHREWCLDFVRGGALGRGSCCDVDEVVEDWCALAAEDGDLAEAAVRSVACDSRNPLHGLEPLVLFRNQTMRLLKDVGSLPWDARVLETPFCDPLGAGQRAWLEGIFQASRAPLRLLGSGSVLLGDPARPPPAGQPGPCSGDNWDCFPRAQRALLAAMQRATRAQGGCWVVLTGDYHFSDLKCLFGRGQGGSESCRLRRSPPDLNSAAVLEGFDPGSVGNVSATWEALGTQPGDSPVYQVMASGMTTSTAVPGRSCANWRLQDHGGLRGGGMCAAVADPAFGLVEVDWKRREVGLQLRSGGEVAAELRISLDTCQVVP